MSQWRGAWGIYSGDWSLCPGYAGLSNLDRIARLHLLGPAAIGAGPDWGGKVRAGQSRLEWIEGRDYGEPSRDSLESVMWVM
jgi:hypothetical protein